MMFCRLAFHALLTFSLTQAHATGGDAELDYAKFDPIIKKAYRDATEAYSVRMINAAKKQKTAAGFLAQVMNVGEDSPERKTLTEIFGDQLAPQVASIQHGVEVIVSPDHRVKLQWGEKMGEALVDGKPAEFHHRKSFRDYFTSPQKEAFTSPLMNALLPTANAQVLNITKQGIILGVKEFWPYIAGMAATGAVGGCLISGHIRWPGEDPIKACAKGAAYGAAMMGGGMATGALLAGVGAEFVYALSAEAKLEIASSVKALLMTGGGMAVLAGSVHGYQNLKDYYGTRITCSKNGNDYSVSSITRDRRFNLYSVSNSQIHIKGRSYPVNVANLAQKLQSDLHITSDQAQALAKGISQEHLVTKEACQQTPGMSYNTWASPEAKKLGEPATTSR